MGDYPRIRYEIRTNHNSGEIYTLGSDRTLKEAKESIDFWRKTNTNPKTIWKLVKSVTIANGVIKRTDINY